MDTYLITRTEPPAGPMFASLTLDTAAILGLLGLSAVQMSLGLWAGRFFWRRTEAAHNRLSPRESAENWSVMHHMAGTLSAQAGHFAHEIAALQLQLAHPEAVDDRQLHQSLLTALTRFGSINERLQAQLASAESRLEQQTRQIESHMSEARTDALTGLHNRRAFDDELTRRVDDFQRKGDPTSLVLVDVDYFKKFNDTYGHQAGDEVLRGVAKVLYANVRDTDVVCRYGGEEFAIICPGQSAVDAQRLAERVRAAVERTVFPLGDGKLNVTVSGGLTQVTMQDSVEDLIRRADEALYASKSAGRNCAHLHNGQQLEPITPLESRRSTDSSPTTHRTPPQLEYRNQHEPLGEAETDSRTDALTGLPNRRAFSEELRRLVAQWRRLQTPLTLVLVDVDFLNVVNQTHGPETGDIVLRAVTQFLTTAVREMDVVARYHGDEFVLLLPGTPLEQGIRAAERIRNAIGMCKLRLSSGELTFTVSMGVAEATNDDNAITLVTRTAAALDASRAAGYNRTHVHNGHACLAVETPSLASR